jgi:asparagine synthase (glutamine-hydrolysing)
MCGIAGLLHQRSAFELEMTAQAMADAIRHRGPDDGGVWVDEEAGLALSHRRLSILDLSAAGHQPMVSTDGRWVISYNGEVYNHAALRAELEAMGVAFRGHSDTETLVEAVARFGVRAVLPRLAGMFALALWDRQERCLVLARDPMGIKPLYWGRHNGALLFASELKAIRALPWFVPEIDRDAVAGFLRFGYVPAPSSIYRGISKLPPGCLLTLRPGAEPVVEPYWSLQKVALAGQAKPLALSDDEATDSLEALLKQVIGEHMISDVPLGAFLSGGIDSSAVTALMQTAGGRSVRTFTIGYDEGGYDESAHARAVAEYLGTVHTDLRATAADARAVIPRLAEWYDEPFADSSQIPTFLVSELTRRSVTVALSGDGGDELFAGYNRHAQAPRIEQLLGLPAPLRKAGAGLISAVSAEGWDGALSMLPQGMRPRLLGNKLHKLARLLSSVDGDEAYARLVGFWPDGLVSGGHLPRRDPSYAEGLPGLVERMQLMDATTYLPDDILTKVDRATMAVSLEARVPFLDHRVVEWAWRLPRGQRLRDGQSKWLLRQVLYRHVPRELIDRPKMGFAVPIAAWLRGPLRAWADDLLSPDSFAAHGLIDPGPIRAAWVEHLAGRGSWDQHLWIVLMFQAWWRRWMA